MGLHQDGLTDESPGVAAIARDWLVGDIGGTHARFALSAAGGALRELQVVNCTDFAGPGAALAAYVRHTGAQPVAACIAVAGPVQGDTFRFTNSAWTLSQARLRDEIGLEQLLLINDFEALALALPELRPEDVAPLGASVTGNPRGVLAVLGPGTGLGVGVLAPAGSRWMAIPSEGGHVGFAPQDDIEYAIAGVLRRSNARISNESILSGPGLETVYSALVEIEGSVAPRLGAAEVIAHALDGSDPRARRTVDLFCAVLGAVAGDVALLVGARGGVFIGGGIAPRLMPLLASSRFRARFEDKGTQRGYVADIPTKLIIAPAPALLGAVAALRAVR